jgi:hypothetical protein
LISTKTPTFRCSRCKHTFVLEIRHESKPIGKKPAVPAKPRLEESDEEDRELSFSFAEPRHVQSEAVADASVSGAPVPKARLETTTAENPSPTPHPEREQDWSLPLPMHEDPPSGATADHTFATPQERGFDTTWWGPAKRAEETQAAIQLSIVPYLVLFVLLLAFFWFSVVKHASNPVEVEKVLRLIPGMQWSVFKNNHLKDRIVVGSVQQQAQFIRGNREVFTISGTIVNRNPVSVRAIRLEGYIFNGSGEEIGHQVISIGNPISVNLIRDIEAKEISILQEIGPQKRFVLPPDESAEFIIVFLKPAKDIRSFAYRVLSAEEAS